MEHHNNDLLLPLTKVETKIQTSPEKFDLDTEMQRKIISITQLAVYRNFESPVNLIPTEILYDIFTDAINTVKDVRSKVKIALAVSCVCRHWRYSALELSDLWRFVDCRMSRKNIELFLCRSKDTPLEVYTDDFARDNLSLKSCTNRIHSLTIRLCTTQFNDYYTYHVFPNPKIQPLQLQYLDVSLSYTRLDDLGRFDRIIVPLTDILRLDVSCLQSLRLQNVDLPWVKLPHNNTLTRLIFCPDYPPTLEQLLVFLSSCTLLCELELYLRFGEEDVPEGPWSTIDRLDFPKLERLVLEYASTWEDSIRDDVSELACLDYPRELSACIGTVGPLSYFSLQYDDLPDWDDLDLKWEYGTSSGDAIISPHDTGPDTILPPSNIFGLVPPKIFRHLSDQVDLFIDLNEKYENGIFKIFSPRNSSASSSISLRLIGSWGASQMFDHSIFELIYSMPKITGLKSGNAAFKYLELWGLDFHDAFPSLSTLELGPNQINEDLNRLPTILRNLDRLILNFTDVLSQEVLLHAVLGAGVKILELKSKKDRSESKEELVDLKEVISTLHQNGVVVLTR